MTQYAQTTTVSSDKTLTEIRQTLNRYKATGFCYMERAETIMVGFEMKGRAIRFTVKTPTLQEMSKTPGRRPRTPAAALVAQKQATQQRWRALLLVIKAKLEAVEAGIETLEEAFMAQMVLPNGKTMGEQLIPQLPEIYRTGDTSSDARFRR